MVFLVMVRSLQHHKQRSSQAAAPVSLPEQQIVYPIHRSEEEKQIFQSILCYAYPRWHQFRQADKL